MCFATGASTLIIRGDVVYLVGWRRRPAAVPVTVLMLDVAAANRMQHDFERVEASDVLQRPAA